MKPHINLAVAGVGLSGKRHAQVILASAGVRLVALAAPSDDAREYAKSIGIDWHHSLEEMLSHAKPDGVIIATPNQVHVENGLSCVAAGCPMLVEKPIATSSAETQILLDAANAKNIPLLVGHHRRHNPLIQKAMELIDGGLLGRIITVQSTCWLLKPDAYYAAAWRREVGAGPVMINAIHDIDLLRHLCGEITSVHAIASNAARGFAVEDTAVVLLQFKSGALGTLSLSDTVASPWSWETSSGENEDFPVTPQSCYLIGGTEGSLSIPDLRIWRHHGGGGEDGEGHWKQPLSATSFPRQNADPLAEQIQHFAKVIRGEEAPLVPGEEGLKSLQVVEAIQQSILGNESVSLM